MFSVDNMILHCTKGTTKMFLKILIAANRQLGDDMVGKRRPVENQRIS